MARPKIVKRICEEPVSEGFVPAGQHPGGSPVTLTFDEYEAIRLIDLEGLSRAECSERMGIARTTAQAIYNSARRKIAECLVRGRELRISGGTYWICDGMADCPGCRFRGRSGGAAPKFDIGEKEKNSMRIAVTYDQGQVFQHFGRTENFKIYDVADGEVRKTAVCGADGISHGALAGLLDGNDVDVLICGGLGGGAMSALEEAGIQVVSGASGDADLAVQDFLAGRLVSSGSNCDLHGHGEGGHSCGSHGGGGCGHSC